MGRPLRIHFPGAIYHVMARGVDGRDVFASRADREDFLSTYKRICAQTGVRSIAYVEMGNHFHLALQVAQIALSSVMQRLLTSYASIFNLRNEREGHLFQARYKACLITDEAYLARVIAYIHQNPVRAGFVRNARDWEWSSVHEYQDDGSGQDWRDFDAWIGAEDVPIILQRTEIAPSADLEKLTQLESERSGLSPAVIRRGPRLEHILLARRRLTRGAVEAGHPLTDIADWLGASRSSISRYLKG